MVPTILNTTVMILLDYSSLLNNWFVTYFQ